MTIIELAMSFCRTVGIMLLIALLVLSGGGCALEEAYYEYERTYPEWPYEPRIEGEPPAICGVKVEVQRPEGTSCSDWVMLYWTPDPMGLMPPHSQPYGEAPLIGCYEYPGAAAGAVHVFKSPGPGAYFVPNDDRATVIAFPIFC